MFTRGERLDRPWQTFTCATERDGDIKEKAQKEIQRESKQNFTQAHTNMKYGTKERTKMRETGERRKGNKFSYVKETTKGRTRKGKRRKKVKAV